MNIRLILVDDHEIMREGLKALIQNEPGMEVVGEAENGSQSVKLAQKTGAHLVIMDVSMPDMNGIEATRKIIAANPHTKVIALSGHANKEFVREMLTAGASAYVLKARAYEELARAIREVMEGKKYLSFQISQKAFWMITSNSPQPLTKTLSSSP